MNNEEKTDRQFEPYAIKGMSDDMIFRVSKWDWAKLKKPVLSVQIGGKLYKVASFNSDETAMWFGDRVREFLGLKSGAGEEMLRRLEEDETQY